MRYFIDSFKRWPDQMQGRDYCAELLIGDDFDFAIEWVDLCDGKRPCAKLRMFEDSFAAFEAWPDLFRALASSDFDRPTVDDVRHLLINLGFKDHTEAPR